VKLSVLNEASPGKDVQIYSKIQGLMGIAWKKLNNDLTKAFIYSISAPFLTLF
jgi:hypothetical protein